MENPKEQFTELTPVPISREDLHLTSYVPNQDDALLRERIADLNNLVLQGNLMEAFERYYDEEVIMQENEQRPTVGKEANRNRELEFLNNITDFREARVLDIAFGKSTSMVLWHYDYTHKEWGTKNYVQVSVQNWRNGKIIKEQFFYGN